MVVNKSDFYKSFKNEYNNTEITKAQYDKITKTLFEYIFNTLTEGKFYELPFKLGTLKILKYKKNKKYIDWYNTKKYNKTIYHQNFHSDGYLYKIVWDKKSARMFKGKLLYKFRAVRWFTRLLAKGIKNNELEFLSE
jgi:nucleoid DNA-binding protein